VTLLPPVRFIGLKIEPSKGVLLPMPQESICSIDVGDMPEDEDRIMLCQNFDKKIHMRFVCGQAQVGSEFGII
jgi:hypothetical protein